MAISFNYSYAQVFIRENELKGLETQVLAAHNTLLILKMDQVMIFQVGLIFQRIMIGKNLKELKRQLKKSEMIQMF